MERQGKRRRDIHFKSSKNDSTYCTHTELAREYARLLEANTEVEAYEVEVELDQEIFPYIPRVDIRKEYFEGAWVSDFVIRYMNGTIAVREIVTEEMLSKRAVIEKLEFSRRYWALSKIDNWKIVVMEKEV
ncbi:MAG: hypothetical protein E7246_00945 [Lachnoclostridium sp.]|nr:hypothetical protein [Lachnoclostridium sp.]